MISVLVVGAGPTGLTLACDLARRGVRVRIIDRVPEFQAGSRGKFLQPRSLEVLDDLGVIDETLASGNPSLTFRHYVRDRMIREIDPQAGLRATSDVPYARGVFIPQWRVEEILRDRLAELGVRVELGSELVDLTQTETAATATVVRDGGSELIEVDYLVGCDGGRSGIRKRLGIGFDGATHDKQVLLCGGRRGRRAGAGRVVPVVHRRPAAAALPASRLGRVAVPGDPDRRAGPVAGELPADRRRACRYADQAAQPDLVVDLQGQCPHG